MKPILEQLKKKNQIAVLIDPEKCQSISALHELIHKVNVSSVDFIFVGGSTVTEKEFERTVSELRKLAKAPIVIFPGSSDQISPKADAILFLSLLSGRNPDFLIGHHVQSAHKVIASKLEVIPTSYLLIDGGTKSAVAYVSQTTPIPRDNVSIARNTALAGKLQGKQVTFLDAGSGAINAVPTDLIKVIAEIDLPLIVGGGVSSVDEIKEMHHAGANVVVIGNKIEQDIDFLLDLKHYQEKVRV